MVPNMKTECVVLCVLVLATVCDAAEFVLLQPLAEISPGTIPRAVSADGSIAVGLGFTSESRIGEAPIWDTQTGSVSLLSDTPISGGFSRSAIGVSADGTTVVGFRTFPEIEPVVALPPIDVFRWTTDEGFTVIDELSDPDLYRVMPEDISGDSSAIVGHILRRTGGHQAFRWSESDGLQLLKPLDVDANSLDSSFANAVSADGNIVAGITRFFGSSEAFRWQEDLGMVGLGTIDGLGTSRANIISADGRVIAGISDSNLGTEAMRWTVETGMEGLGLLDSGDLESEATAVSADGRWVLGYSRGQDAIARAFVWDSSSGMRSLSDVLEEDHLLVGVFDGWTSAIPQDISDDGLTIVGVGRDENGTQQGWALRLDRPIGVPEPANAVLMMLASSIYLSRAKRRRSFRGKRGTNRSTN